MFAIAETMEAPVDEKKVGQGGEGAVRFGDGVRMAPAIIGRETWRQDAAILGRFLDVMRAEGGLQDEVPLLIVDLSPGDGERAWQLLRLWGGNLPTPSYLAICANAEEREGLRSQPMVRTLLESGRLRLALSPWNEAGWRRLLGSPKNPVVIFGHGLFSRLRHDLYGCHYGQWLEAWLVSGEEESPCETLKLAWREGDRRDALVDFLKPIYLRGINSASFLAPTGAFECLNPLIRGCGGRYLLVASDIGTRNLSEIRQGALACGIEALALEDALPVNFHALSAWLESNGAGCASFVEEDGQLVAGPLWQIALRDKAFPALARALPGILAGCAEDVASSETWRGIAARMEGEGESEDPCARQAFLIWKMSGFSPRLMLTLFRGLLAQASCLDESALGAWRKALAACCEQYFPRAEDEGFHRVVAHLGATLGVWALAVSVLEARNALHGLLADEVRLLACCLQRGGCSREALGLLEEGVAYFADDADLEKEFDLLRERLQAWDALPWFEPALAEDGELRLEPIGEEHAAAFLYQYRDPQIGMMTRLPEFEGEEGVVAWIAERRAEAGRIEFALMHFEYGFAGIVSAHRIAENAFFHLWIGADFQGQGLAIPAIRLMCAQLERLGVSRVFTAAYPDNFRSTHTLVRAGFEAMSERALPPEEKMVFFCLGLGGNEGCVGCNAMALRDYCAHSGGVFLF